MTKEEADQLATDVYNEFVANNRNNRLVNDDGLTELCFKSGFLMGLRRGAATQNSDKQETGNDRG